MTIDQQIEDSIFNIFSSVTTSTYNKPTNKGNVYELYLFILIYKTLKRISGNRTTINNPQGLSSFIFRNSPGLISNNRFSYATVTKNGNLFELRNGIEIVGINMYHEMDLILFRNNQIDNSRPDKSNGEIVFVVECKNHGSISSLKGEVRKFLGAITDLADHNHSGAGCLHCGVSPKPFFVTPLNAPTNHKYRTYASNYGLNPQFNLRPSTTEEQFFITEIENMYRSL